MGRMIAGTIVGKAIEIRKQAFDGMELPFVPTPDVYGYKQLLQTGVPYAYE